MAADEVCLENIDEYVNDENRIVTCKWLSLTLKIHINQAKRLLHTFLNQQRKKDSQVNATYFLAGLSKNSNGISEHKCLVVPEEDLEATRKQMFVVTSCHVYSVQRTHIKDPNVLYTTDYNGLKDNFSDVSRYSSIRCMQAAMPRPKPVVVSRIPDKIQGGNTGSKNSAAEEVKQNSKDSVTSKSKKEPKGSIATMFAQSGKKNSEEDSRGKETSATSQIDDKKPGKPLPKKGSVMDLFANAKPVAKAKVSERETERIPSTKETKAPKSDSNSNLKSTKTTKPNVKKIARIRDDSDEDQPDRKRRRRIKDDMFESSSEEELEIPDSPVPSPKKERSPQPDSPLARKKQQTELRSSGRETTSPKDHQAKENKVRKRRRKLVPKTSLDEDGFMVTENVWESESTDASELEEEVKKPNTVQKVPKAPPRKTSPQKKPSPVKGKQTSLMAFFKKK